MIGVVGILGIIIAFVLTGVIGKVLFRNCFGTLRAWAGAYVVVFCIVLYLVWGVLGKVIGMGNSGNAASNRAVDHYDETYSGYTGDQAEYNVKDTGYNSNSYDDEQYYEDDDWSAEDEYILPYSDYEYLEAWQLEDLTKEELRIARNEIFARHGRIFNDKALMSYFENKSWYYPEYEPDEFDSQMENILNAVEKENLQMIKNEESRR